MHTLSLKVLEIAKFFRQYIHLHVETKVRKYGVDKRDTLYNLLFGKLLLLTIRCVLIREHGQVIYTASQLEEATIKLLEAWIREFNGSDVIDSYVVVGNIAVNWYRIYM